MKMKEPETEHNNIPSIEMLTPQMCLVMLERAILAMPVNNPFIPGKLWNNSGIVCVSSGEDH